jgi:pimeloyl-ACP methyl ester carboxylesterase
MTTTEAYQRQMAGNDSRFIGINGFNVHYRTAGNGKNVLVLLHGSFLSLRSWRSVFEPLAETATVIAFDRPAFGLTSRPLPATGKHNLYSPEAQSDLVVALLEKLGHRQAVLVGNSTGGTLALLTALRYPAKVKGLVLADAMVYGGYATSEFPSWLYPVLRAATPLGERMMKLMIRNLYDLNVRSFWYDKAKLQDDVLASFRHDMMVGRWGRSFWELLLSSHCLDLERRLADIRVPSLVISGDHDRTVKTSESMRLSEDLPDASLVIVPDCGHLPQEEQPEAFVLEVLKFLKDFKA